MKPLLLAAAAAAVALTATAAPAEARQGCGPNGHRDYYGRCVPNRGPVVVAPGLVIGNFYRGRGYWDGRRYWHNRYRDHDRGHWRYR